jgi:predicted dehydrogenase
VVDLTMSGRLRSAVVGTGFVGPHHVDAIRRGGFADVVVLAGNVAAQVEEKAQALGIARWTTDVEGVMADPAIDVVHIATPNHTHEALGLAALAAGRHVVLEKPLSLDSAGAARLVAAAAASGRHAAVAFTYRGYPMVRRARALVAAGDIGELRLGHGAYLQDWLLEATDWNWRIDPGVGGRSRAVADIGSHWFDTLEFTTGRQVEAVFADLATFVSQRARPTDDVEAFAGASGPAEQVRVASEDAGILVLRLEGGARATCLVSQVSPGHRNAMTIELGGSRRSLAWAQETPETLWMGARERASQVLVREPGDGYAAPGVPPLPGGHPEGWSEAMRDLFRPFYAAIAAGAPPPAPGAAAPYPTFADGARAVRFVDAVLESARTGRWAEIASLSA